MIKLLLLFGLFSANLFLQSCNLLATNDNLKTQKEQSTIQNQSDNSSNADNAAPKIEKSKANSQTVNFKDASFNYNPQIFGEIKMDEVAELPLCENCKADAVAPEHLLFKLENSNSNRETKIYVFPIEDYRRMFAVSKEVTEAFDEELKNLHKALKDKNLLIKHPNVQNF